MDTLGCAERRPYAVPGSLADLAGPVSGVVRLPASVGWTGRTEYDLDDDADRDVLYERVLVEATSVEDVTAVLDETLLRSNWRRLFLPAAVRRAWEHQFIDLVGA
jgi:hypothetical protein